MKSFELLVGKRCRGWARSSKRSYRIGGLLASCAALVASEAGLAAQANRNVRPRPLSGREVTVDFIAGCKSV